MKSHQQEDSDSDFEDMHDESSEDEESSLDAQLHYTVIRHRYRYVVPGDIVKLLNKGNKGELR